MAFIILFQIAGALTPARAAMGMRASQEAKLVTSTL